MTQSFTNVEFDKLVNTTYNKPNNLYSFEAQEPNRIKSNTYRFKVPKEKPEDLGNTEIPLILGGPIKCVKFDIWRNTDLQNVSLNLKTECKISDNELIYAIRSFWRYNFYPHIKMVLYDLYNRKLLKSDYVCISII